MTVRDPHLLLEPLHGVRLVDLVRRTDLRASLLAATVRGKERMKGMRYVAEKGRNVMKKER